MAEGEELEVSGRMMTVTPGHIGWFGRQTGLLRPKTLWAALGAWVESSEKARLVLGPLEEGRDRARLYGKVGLYLTSMIANALLLMVGNKVQRGEFPVLDQTWFGDIYGEGLADGFCSALAAFLRPPGEGAAEQLCADEFNSQELYEDLG